VRTGVESGQVADFDLGLGFSLPYAVLGRCCFTKFADFSGRDGI